MNKPTRKITELCYYFLMVTLILIVFPIKGKKLAIELTNYFPALFIYSLSPIFFDLIGSISFEIIKKIKLRLNKK